MIKKEKSQKKNVFIWSSSLFCINNKWYTEKNSVAVICSQTSSMFVCFFSLYMKKKVKLKFLWEALDQTKVKFVQNISGLFKIIWVFRMYIVQ